jgi:hypothetical protein
MKKILIAALTSAIILIPAIVLALEINIAPVFYYRSNDEGTTFNALGPVFEKTDDVTAVRPLFFNDNDETDFLYPLGRSSEGITRFLPIYYSDTNEPHPYTTIFPVFWGNYKGKSYGGVFPLYGKMIHRFGKDEAEFCLWPVYMRTKVGEKNTYTMLWPVFTVSKGTSYKVFPLYGWEKHMNGVSQYLFWPLLFRERGEKNMDAFLPLFQYTTWSDAWSASILWPFFTYGRDNGRNQTGIDAPWPLIKYARGEYNETMVFPLYYNSERDNIYKTRMYLWPIWYEAEISDANNNYYKKNGRFCILISWRKANSQGEDSIQFNLWPLYYITKDEDLTSWHFPSVFPFDYTGVENNWAPIFTFISYEKKLDKSHFDILWKTFYLDRNAEFMRWALSFLVSFENSPQYWQIGFLSDILKLRREKFQKTETDNSFESDAFGEVDFKERP